MLRVVAIGTLLFALTGCGTIHNFQRESPADATVYGGVKIAADQFRPTTSEHNIVMFCAWPVFAADVGLSAVGDTLTLPITVLLAILNTVGEVDKSISDYYFPKNKPMPNAPATETPKPAPNP